MNLQGNHTFNNNAVNNSTIALTGTFHNQTINSGVVETGFFFDDAQNQDTVTAATFANSSCNASTGTVTIATFTNAASNVGLVQSTATFHDITLNIGNVPGTAYFNNSSINLSGATVDVGYFNDYTVNSGTVAVSSTFYDNAENRGVVESIVFNGHTKNTGVVKNAIFKDNSTNEGTVVYNATFEGLSINLSSGNIQGDAFFYEQGANEGGNINGTTNRTVYYWYPDTTVQAVSTTFSDGTTALTAAPINITDYTNYWKEVSMSLDGAANTVTLILSAYTQNGVYPLNPTLLSSVDLKTRQVVLSSVNPNDVDLTNSNLEVFLLGDYVPYIEVSDLNFHTYNLRDRYLWSYRYYSQNSLPCTPLGTDFYYSNKSLFLAISGEGVNSIVPTVSANIQVQKLGLYNVSVSSFNTMNFNYLDSLIAVSCSISATETKLTPLNKIKSITIGNANNKFKQNLNLFKSTLSYEGVTTAWDWYGGMTRTYPSYTAGPQQLFVLGSTGVLVSGKNDKGQLGVGTLVNIEQSNNTVLTGQWKKIVSGKNFTAGIKADNTLWAWGDNTYGQLGKDPQTISYTTEPVLVSDNKWLDVAVGDNHIIGTCWTGLLFSERPTEFNGGFDTSYSVLGYGDNSKGQLGVSTSQVQSSYTPVTIHQSTIRVGANCLNIDSNDRVLDNFRVVASDDTSAYFRNNTWYMFGDNTYGQLGLDPTTTPFTEVAQQVVYQDLYLGSGYAIAVNNLGDVYGRGRNNYGQLGHNTTEGTSTFIQINTYGNFYRHIQPTKNRVLAVDFNDNMWIWGLDTDNTSQLLVPTAYHDDNDSYFTVVGGESYILAINTEDTGYITGTIIN